MAKLIFLPIGDKIDSGTFRKVIRTKYRCTNKDNKTEERFLVSINRSNINLFIYTLVEYA
jgi:hypothetical protein